MQRGFLALCLLLLALNIWATEYRFNGIKPAVIIDVRTPAEFAAGHIDGAVNIPYDQIDQGISTIKAAKKDSLILLYCHSGRRSALAMQTLAQRGFKRVYDGGSQQSLQASLKPCPTLSC